MNDIVIGIGLLIVAVVEVISSIAIYLAAVKKDEMKELKDEMLNHISELKTDFCEKMKGLKQDIKDLNEKIYDIVQRLDERK